MLHRKQGAKALAIAATAVVTMGAAPPSAHYSPRSRLEKGSIAEHNLDRKRLIYGGFEVILEA